MKITWKYSVAAGVLLIPFVLAMGFIFPDGDDFERCNRASHLFDVSGGLHEMGRAWWKWSGRYTHHFLVVFLGRVVLSREACALTAAGMALLHFIPLYGIFSVLQGGRRRESAFLALFCFLTIYCGYQNLPESFYSITGIFSIGVSGGMTLLFLWALCRLWFAPAMTRGAVCFPVISGILAIGCYEHSALATLLAAGIAFGMARLYRHPHEAAFRKVLFWIGAFFLLSFLCRGNFRRQTKRGTDIHVIFDQLGNAWDDWLTYGFWVFASVLPIAAVVVGGLARPRWRVSLADKLSIPVMMILGGAAYILLSASIVFVHALSDVPISLTSKLPASLALLSAYLLAFLVLACGDGLRRKLSALPAWLVIPPLFVVICTAPNMRRTVESLLTGEDAVYAAAVENRFAWLSSSEARNEKPVLVADLGVAPFPFVFEAVRTRTSLWPNNHIAKMFGLPGGICRVPLDAKAALARVDSHSPAQSFQREVPEALRDLGVKRLRLIRGVTGGPNPTFLRDWLFVDASRPLSSLTTLTLVENEKEFVSQTLGRRLAERAIRKSVLPANAAFFSLDRLAGVERVHEPTAVIARSEQDPVYALPVHIPAAGRMSGLFLRIGSSDLYRVFP